MSELKISPIPNHVAIIMDGNGRWAQARRLPRIAGHRAGTENIRRVIEHLAEYEIKYVTLYAFSTENWSRPASEVQGLFNILATVIDREVKRFHQRGIKLVLLGRVDRLSAELAKKVRQALELTEGNSRMTVSIAFDYGGRAEILSAVQRIIKDRIPAEAVDESLLSRYLYTAGLPDPDLIIRTAGEMRLSNFLLWQSAYSEYYVTPAFWPDFDRGEVEKALTAYSQRQRRFGGLEVAKETGAQR